jgi:hypothetical protein
MSDTTRATAPTTSTSRLATGITTSGWVPLKGCTEWRLGDQEARLLPESGQHRQLHHCPLAGLRRHVAALYNPRSRTWKIYWASNRLDGLEPPVEGAFDADGVGVFEGRQELDGRPIRVRFTWSRITPTSALWEQAFSPDDGKTWEKNWIMTMTRVD